MKFEWHLLIGFVVSYILVQFFGFSLIAGLIIFLSSWMIDIDAYFWYAIEFKKLNPINAIKWYIKYKPKYFKLSTKEKNQYKKMIRIFHGIPFIAIILVMSFYHKFFLWVLMGTIIHMTADWVDLIKIKESLCQKLFPCYTMIKNKGKKSLYGLSAINHSAKK